MFNERGDIVVGVDDQLIGLEEEDKTGFFSGVALFAFRSRGRACKEIQGGLKWDPNSRATNISRTLNVTKMITYISVYRTFIQNRCSIWFCRSPLSDDDSSSLKLMPLVVVAVVVVIGGAVD
jgi:hypothetical protein